MTTKLREPINVRAFFNLVFTHAFMKYCPVCKKVGEPDIVVDVTDVNNVIRIALGYELEKSINMMQTENDFVLVHIGPPIIRWARDHEVGRGGDERFRRPERGCGLVAEIANEDLRTWVIEALSDTYDVLRRSSMIVVNLESFVANFEREDVPVPA